MAAKSLPKRKQTISQEDFTKLLKRFVEKGSTLKGMRGISDETMEAVYGLAYNNYNNGKFDEASRLFGFLGGFDPYQSKYWIGLAAARQMLKQYQGAIQAYSMAALMAEEDPNPSLYAADCYMIMGKKELAEKALTAAVHWASRKPEYSSIKDRAESLLRLLREKAPEEKPAPTT